MISIDDCRICLPFHKLYIIMPNIVRTFLHYCRRLLLYIAKGFTFVFPKDQKLILFSAWFGQKYSDSSMYQYEYMLENSKYRVCWYTKNKALYKDLIAAGKPVVYSKSLKGLWIHLRAKMLVTSVQFNDFNEFLIGNCILLDLDHGYPIKEGHFKQNEAASRGKIYEYIVRWNVKYYMSASSKFCMEKICECFEITPNDIVFCNKPRIDALFDNKLRCNKNPSVEKIKKGRKAVVWMPTHRSCGNKPIQTEAIFDLQRIEELCVSNNFVFLIKKHFYHKNEVVDLKDYPHIFDITQEDIETQTLLSQTDILITDYSACYIDYLALDRPIILYAYDLEEYLQHERAIYLKFEDNNVGAKAYDRDGFSRTLESITNKWVDEEHIEGRHNIRRIYFDDNVEMGSSRDKVCKIIDDIFNEKYVFDWTKLSSAKITNNVEQ